MRQLEAHQYPLGKIFSSDYDFRIPDYQRPYAWSTEEAGQLLADLVDALERAEAEPYFLGSIVLVKDPISPGAEVIDGQQRLTTTSLLLAVLRELSADSAVAAELDELLMEPGKVLQGLAARPRLTLRARDAFFFHDHVQAKGQLDQLVAMSDGALKTDAQRAIRDNASLLRTQLLTWTDTRRTALAQLLIQRTYLVVVSTPDLQSAHRIFSVMNARGLDLSPADIFKSQVIGALPAGASDDYAKKWEDAEEDLGRDDFADLFLHVRMIFARKRAERELLKEFPEQVLNGYLPDRPKEFVDDVVVPYANAYAITRKADYVASTGADLVNLWLRRLAPLDNNDWRPPAMWALRHRPHDPQWLAAFLQRLERLASSMFVRRVYATPRAQRYAALLTQLDQGHGLDAPAFELSVEEKVDTLERLGGEVYQVGKIVKHVLLRLDDMLANQPGVAYQHAVVSVEHVLPQSPRDDSEWRKIFTEDQRQHWTHRLANLVLLNRTKNSEAQNFEFDVKKSKYFTSKHGVATFALTSQVLGTAVWTPQVLQERQAALLSALASGWDLA